MLFRKRLAYTTKMLCNSPRFTRFIISIELCERIEPVVTVYVLRIPELFINTTGFDNEVDNNRGKCRTSLATI